MNQDRLQLQRFELKYIVPEVITESIRNFVRPYLGLDEHGAGQPQYSYQIHSVYLDSDAYALYWDTIKARGTATRSDFASITIIRQDRFTSKSNAARTTPF
jgi:hypothetical protein